MIASKMPENLERIETNLKYLIELDLSDDEILKDPLSLAFYHHFLHKNGLENINKSMMVSWARNYCYQKVVQQELSRKRDTEITAATLAYSTLKKDKGYPQKKKEEIETSLKALLKKEKGKDGLFFGRPNFTAIILYATREAEMPIDEEKEILQTLLARYSDNKNLNNIIGLPFLIQLLIESKEEAELKKLTARLNERLEDNLLDYDDKAYLVSTLWKYHDKMKGLQEFRPVAESVIEKTPIMISDIINKGDISDITVRQDNLKISRLYKAVFLDIVMSYKNHLAMLTEEELDRRYSSDSSLKWGEFGAFSLIPCAITLSVGYLLMSYLKAGLSFWIFQQTNVTWRVLLPCTLSLLLVTYLVVASITGIYSLYSSIIKKNLIRDMRVWDYYKKHQFSALKWFSISVLGALILSVFSRLVGSAFQDYLKK